MKQAWGDAWCQLLFFIVVVAGGLGALGLYAPAAYARRAKAPGRWIVDARLAADADSSTVGGAVAAAAEGDTVFIRPGVYRESVSVERALRLVGLGAPGAVIVESPGDAPALRLRGGPVFLKALTLSQPGAGAALSLDAAGASGIGLTVRGGFPAIALAGGSRARFQDLSISGGETALVARGAGVSARLAGVRVSGTGDAGLSVRDGAVLEVERGEIAGRKGCGVEIARAEADLTGVSLALNGCGVGFEGGGTLDARGSDLQGNLQGALRFLPGDRGAIVLRGQGNRPDLDALLR